jgi:hypothetical protein
MAADPVELAVGQHAQQAGLQLGRHVADLVEEQGAAVGLLEAAPPLRRRTGEGAALVTEQLGFQQVLRNRSGIQRDERPGCTRAVAVQRTRDQFLAAAGFAGDKHGGVRLAEPADGAEHLLHRRRLAEHFGDRRLARHRRFAAGAFGQRAAHQFERLVDVERLRQVFERPALERRHGAVEVGIRGHDDDRHLGQALLQRLQQFQPGHPRHADVGQHRSGRAAFQFAQCVGRRTEGHARDILAQQGLFQHPADGAVVVDDPDTAWFRHGVQVGSGRKMENTVWPGSLSQSMVPWFCATSVCATASPRPLPPSRPDTSG